jgi:AraC-like DNA-binding protein
MEAQGESERQRAGGRADAAASYRRYTPPDGVEHVIEHLWVVEAPARMEPVREILIPNGRPTVVLALGDLGVRHDPLTGTATANGNTVFGITTRPYVLEQRGVSHYVGAQLRPYGLAALMPGRHLVDEFVGLDAWLGAAPTAALLREVDGHAQPQHQAAALGAFLRRWCAPIPADRLSLLRALVAVVDEEQGRLRVADLARRLLLSQSSLYRLCSAFLGVGPKQFLEVSRYFHFVGGLLEASGGESTGLLARLHGYYDQAHATRRFKAFTGVSPGVFATTLNGIARLMHGQPAQPDMNDSYKTA